MHSGFHDRRQSLSQENVGAIWMATLIMLHSPYQVVPHKNYIEEEGEFRHRKVSIT